LENTEGERTNFGLNANTALNSPSATTFENNKKIGRGPQTENELSVVGGGGNEPAIQSSRVLL